MTLLLRAGSTGADVARLRKVLAGKLGAAAASYPGLATGSSFDAGTDSAVRNWQSGAGIVADGVIGPYCQQLLGLVSPGTMAVALTVQTVQHLFPATKATNIRRYLPYVAAALDAAGLRDRPMILAALGTIRAESEGFVPISEMASQYNTHPGQAPFSAYEGRTALGNTQPGDGARFRGRGFVQLSGRDNYTRYGTQLGIDLAGNPDLANAPEVAAVLLAMFLADKATAMRKALAANRYADARKLVNGGSYGLDRFKDVFARAATAVPTATTAGVGAGRRKAATAKGAKGHRHARAAGVAARPLNATKDPTDLRDRPYTPPPVSLPVCYPGDALIGRYLPAYTKAGLIMDQGSDGACTGFGLACVINYLRWRGHGEPARFASVSPRMLYDFARRYDEYAGEDYEGSSCRGALKGWYYHGVCLQEDWPYDDNDKSTPAFGYADRAAQNTLGVYYRIDIDSITDLQAAIMQVGAVYVSANTHDGWSRVPTSKKKITGHDALPAIDFDGRPGTAGGHAFALVGFNTRGFVLQNSWGKNWGGGGFAVVTYADWLVNGMDAWVAAMGVPGVMQGQIVGASKGGANRASLDKSQWWDEATAYEHSVVFKDDGRIGKYLTQDHLANSLQFQCATLPDQWFRAQGGKVQRVVIYAHGGLNAEDAAITRARAMGRYFTGNGCYPLFMVWKTGLWESIGGILDDHIHPSAGPAGATALSNAGDFLIEKTFARPFAKPLWTEMKSNALDCNRATRGVDQLASAMQSLATSWPKLEIHVVGHSAGSIFLGYLLELFASRGLGERLASVHLYAPACTVAFANQYYAPHADLMRSLYVDILSDRNEQDDTVGAYRKSLLYLVSNALETDVRTPILGLANVLDAGYTKWDGTSVSDAALTNWRRSCDEAGMDERTTLNDSAKVLDRRPDGTITPSHGSFDNDVDLLTRTLERITGAKLKMAVDDLEGY